MATSTDGDRDPAGEKQRRLAAALRENLRRRKAQERARRDTAAARAVADDATDRGDRKGAASGQDKPADRR